jgi:hypothetical protein
VLAGDECLLEIPRLAAGFVMQAGIITGDEFQFFRERFYLERRSQRGLVQIGHVTMGNMAASGLQASNLKMKEIATLKF